MCSRRAFNIRIKPLSKINKAGGYVMYRYEYESAGFDF